MKKNRFKAHIESLIAVVIWGIASVVIKATLKGIDPSPFLAYRFMLSSALALPFLPGVLHLFRKHTNLKLLILLYGLLVSPVALGILFAALNETSVINLSLLAALAPLLITFLGARLFHDHLSKKAKLGVGIAVCGAIFTLFEPLFLHYDPGSLYGNCLLVLYIASDVASILVLKKLMKKGVDPLALTNLSFFLGLLVFVPLVIVQSSVVSFFTKIIQLPFIYHLGVIFMALFSGTIAFTLRAKAQKTLNVSEESMFGYLTPLISTILAILFLNEAITPLYILGALLITVGVFIVEYHKAHN